MTTIEALQQALQEKREAYKTADKETRELLARDAEIIKLRIRVLEVAQRARQDVGLIKTVNLCKHPITERHYHKDGSESCEACNTLFPKGQ